MFKWLKWFNKTFGIGVMTAVFLLLLGYGSIQLEEHINEIDTHFVGYFFVLLFISLVYVSNFVWKNRMEIRLPVRVRLLIDSGLPELCGLFMMVTGNFPVGCFIIIVNTMLQYGIRDPNDKSDPFSRAKKRKSSAVSRWVHLTSLDDGIEKNTSYICDGFKIFRCSFYCYCSELLSPSMKTRPLRFFRYCDGDNLDEVQQTVKWLYEFSPFLFGLESECRDYYGLLHMRHETGRSVFTAIYATYMMFSIEPVWYDNRTRFSYRARGSFYVPIDYFKVEKEVKISAEYPYAIVIDGRSYEDIAHQSLEAIYYLVDQLNQDVVDKYKNLQPWIAA